MKYRYKAVSDQGQQVKGVMEAVNQKAAAAHLRDQKLTVVVIEPLKSLFDLNALSLKMSKVSSTEVTTFTRQLSTMITAGLPITDALNLLKVQSSPQFSPTVSMILTDVQGGVSLSEALAKHPKIFSKVYVALVKAGESAGIMDTILNRLAASMEKSREFTSKVRGAMVYPVIVVVGMVGVMILMMVVVVPKLTTLYDQFNEKLPLATRIVVGMSDFTINFWWLGIIIAVALSMGVRSYLANPQGRRQWDSFVYKLPVAGIMLQQIMLTEFTRTVSLLVGAGVSIVDSLNIVAAALGNTVMEAEARKIAKQVEKGFPVSVSFTESDKFPPIVGQMIAVGEETGKLDEVLEKLSHYYESESEERVKGLTTAIEPLIIVLLGGAVGFLVFSIIMPIYNITNKI